MMQRPAQSFRYILQMELGNFMIDSRKNATTSNVAPASSAQQSSQTGSLSWSGVMMVKHLKTEALAKFALGFSKNLPLDDGLYFHEDLRDLGQKMTQLLHQQRTLYETLCNDTVDMISVYELAKAQIELRDQVYQKMLALYSKNQDNYDLNLIIEVYREAVQFRKDRFFKEINEKAISAQDLGLKNIIFSTSACVLFVSSSHREGIISKVEGAT